MISQEEQIRHRAYEIWELEGRPDGRAHEHWAQAMSECADMVSISAAADTQASVKKTRAPAKPRAKAGSAEAKPVRRGAKAAQVVLN
jgi:hypothetical protein